VEFETPGLQQLLSAIFVISREALKLPQHFDIVRKVFDSAPF